MKRLLILPFIIIYAFCGSAKVNNQNVGGKYYYETSVVKYRGGWPKLHMSIAMPRMSYIEDLEEKGNTIILCARFYTFKSTDESFANGHRMRIRLNNDKEINGKLVWPASPNIYMSDNGQNSAIDLPDRFPGFEFSKSDIDEMAEIGFKKIRIEHSKGYFDYNFDEKDSQSQQKKFQKSYTELLKYLEKNMPTKHRPVKSNGVEDTF